MSAKVFVWHRPGDFYPSLWLIVLNGSGMEHSFRAGLGYNPVEIEVWRFSSPSSPVHFRPSTRVVYGPPSLRMLWVWNGGLGLPYGPVFTGEPMQVIDAVPLQVGAVYRMRLQENQ